MIRIVLELPHCCPSCPYWVTFMFDSNKQITLVKCLQFGVISKYRCPLEYRRW